MCLAWQHKIVKKKTYRKINGPLFQNQTTSEKILSREKDGREKCCLIWNAHAKWSNVNHPTLPFNQFCRKMSASPQGYTKPSFQQPWHLFKVSFQSNGKYCKRRDKNIFSRENGMVGELAHTYFSELLFWNVFMNNQQHIKGRKWVMTWKTF